MTEEKKLILLNGIDTILDGIERTEDEKPGGGWWETSKGAEFGEEKLAELKTFILKQIDDK